MSHGTFAHLEGHRGGLLDITVESRGAGNAAETGEAGSRGGNRRGGCAAHNRHDWVRAGPIQSITEAVSRTSPLEEGAWRRLWRFAQELNCFELK